jgi:hypothetical protein
MRSCLILLFCFCFCFCYSQKQKHALSFKQRLSVFCFLMQPLQSDSSFYIYPDRYAKGLLYLQFRNDPKIQHYLVDKMDNVLELLFRMVIMDSIAFYDKINFILPDSADRIERALSIKNVLSNKGYMQLLKQEFDIERKVRCLTSALPFLSSVSVTGKKKKEIHIEIFDNDQLQVPKDILVRYNAYPLFLAIATMLVLREDAKEVGVLIIDVPSMDAGIAYHTRSVYDMEGIQKCIDRFNQFTW